jgi:dCTP diphosphatase
LASQESSFQALTRNLREFRVSRGWVAIHTPRNLATSLAIEVGELLEYFQWTVVSAEARKSDPKAFQGVSEEIADVVIYAIQLADVLDIDLEQAIRDKMDVNAQKHGPLR